MKKIDGFIAVAISNRTSFFTPRVTITCTRTVSLKIRGPDQFFLVLKPMVMLRTTT